MSVTETSSCSEKNPLKNKKSPIQHFSCPLPLTPFSGAKSDFALMTQELFPKVSVKFQVWAPDRGCEWRVSSPLSGTQVRRPPFLPGKVRLCCRPHAHPDLWAVPPPSSAQDSGRSGSNPGGSGGFSLSTEGTFSTGRIRCHQVAVVPPKV